MRPTTSRTRRTAREGSGGVAIATPPKGVGAAVAMPPKGVRGTVATPPKGVIAQPTQERVPRSTPAQIIRGLNIPRFIKTGEIKSGILSLPETFERQHPGVTLNVRRVVDNSTLNRLTTKILAEAKKLDSFRNGIDAVGITPYESAKRVLAYREKLFGALRQLATHEKIPTTEFISALINTNSFTSDEIEKICGNGVELILESGSIENVTIYKEWGKYYRLYE